MARLWSKLFLSYLAGFVDGEGTIGVSKRKRIKWFCYDPYLSIANSDLPVLEYINKTIGFGSIRRSKSIRFGRKPVYSYWTSNKNAKTIIKALYPYLIVKKEQAKLLLDMPKRGGTYTPKTETNRREQQEIVYIKLKKIHGYRRKQNE